MKSSAIASRGHKGLIEADPASRFYMLHIFHGGFNLKGSDIIMIPFLCLCQHKKRAPKNDEKALCENKGKCLPPKNNYVGGATC